MKSTLLLLVAVVSGCRACAQGTTIFMEDFSNPTAAAGQFTVTGNGSFASGLMRLSPGSVAVLNPGNLHDGGEPIQYSVIQSFSGTIDPSADFRVRGATGHQYDGYYLTTAILGGQAYIALSRRTDVERQMGIVQNTLIGGTSFAPTVLGTPGPYKVDVTLINTATSVKINVSIDGVTALFAEDTSPYQLTSGDSLGFYSNGSQNAYWDNLSVTSVPEPRTYALLGVGLAALVCIRRWRFEIAAPLRQPS